LLAFVLGLTESLPAKVHELAGYIYFVIGQKAVQAMTRPRGAGFRAGIYNASSRC